MIFMKSDIHLFFENMSRKFKSHYNMARITGTLHEHQYTFTITSLAQFFYNEKHFRPKL